MRTTIYRPGAKGAVVSGRRRMWMPGDEPGPYAWLRPDSAPNPVASWPDSFGLGHGTGTQATSGKRPTIVTSGGRTLLRGVNASLTSLPVSWTLGTKNTFYLVCTMSAANATYYFSNSDGLNASISYGFTANNLEWLNLPERIVILNGTTGLHVISVSHTDGANIRVYADGNLINDTNNAGVTSLSGRIITNVFGSGSVGAASADIGDLIVYMGAAHTSAQQAANSKRLMRFYGL